MSAESDAKTAAAHSETRVRVYLVAGQVFASRTPSEITTVLGSCVSVVLVDASRRIGGASHFLLPFDGGGRRPSARFGNVAIAELMARMVAQGSSKGDLVAKVFGGSSMHPQAPTHGESLGAQNVGVARLELAKAGIPIVAEDVGGCSGRKVIVFTDRGQVWVKKL